METVRFLRYFSPGQGDYTQERYDHPVPNLDGILEQMEALPAPKSGQYEETI